MDNVAFQSTIYGDNQAPYAGAKIARVFDYIVGSYVRGRVIDVGAGDGSLMAYLRSKRGLEVFGVDIEPKTSDIIKADIASIPFESSSFDTAVMTEVLEHLLDDQQVSALSEIRRLLKSSGHLITTVPYKENYARNVVACPHCGESFHRYGHWAVFDEDSMTKLLEANGFKVVFCKPYSVGAMAAYGVLKHFNFVYKHLTHLEAFSQTLFTVARRA